VQIPTKKLPIKSPVLKAGLIFLAMFIVSVILWVQVKNSYCHAVTVVASKVLAEVKGATLGEVINKGDVFYVALSILKGREYHIIWVTNSSNLYVFTIPLTLSLLVSLTPFITKKKRAYAEAFIILVLVHSFYVFSVEATELTEQSMRYGIEPVNATELAIYQYLWKASEFTVIAFAPFLIATYVFVRFRRQADIPKKQSVPR
jgi:hypothetical protein